MTEDIFIDKTVMLFGEQVEHIGCKQPVLVKLHWGIFEFWRWGHFHLVLFMAPELYQMGYSRSGS